jgi:hypothetical protein
MIGMDDLTLAQQERILNVKKCPNRIGKSEPILEGGQTGKSEPILEGVTNKESPTTVECIPLHTLNI